MVRSAVRTAVCARNERNRWEGGAGGGGREYVQETQEDAARAEVGQG